jgi:RNA polymerase sigma factor (sigma-70 family)
VKVEQVAMFEEYTELRKNPELNSKRIERIEATLVKMNQGLIYYVARRYPAIKFHVDEINTVGMATLLEAVRTYEPERGDFGPYAVQQLRSSDGLQSIDRFHVCGPIKIPHNAFVNYLKEKRKINSENCTEELSDEALAVDSAISNISRFGEEQEDSTTLDDIVEQSTFDSPLEGIESQQMNNALTEVLASMEDRERMVIYLTYGMKEDVEALDLRSVGRELGISHEMVRKIRNKALDRLRKRMIAYLKCE